MCWKLASCRLKEELAEVLISKCTCGYSVEEDNPNKFHNSWLNVYLIATNNSQGSLLQFHTTPCKFTKNKFQHSSQYFQPIWYFRAIIIKSTCSKRQISKGQVECTNNYSLLLHTGKRGQTCYFTSQ